MFDGHALDVIVERISDGYATGHASNYLKVKFPVPVGFDTSIVKVEITKTGYPINDGKIVVD